MASINLIESFQEFKDAEGIDRPLPETTAQLMERLYAERAKAVLRTGA